MYAFKTNHEYLFDLYDVYKMKNQMTLSIGTKDHPEPFPPQLLTLQ